MAYSPVGFINRLKNKVSFSEDSTLDIGAHDMGLEQVSVTINDDGGERLRVATGTVFSYNIFCLVTATISVRKTSPMAQRYLDRFSNDCFIGGTATLYDDAGNYFTAYNPSISLKDMGALNGTEPAYKFEFKADLIVNKEALSGF